LTLSVVYALAGGREMSRAVDGIEIGVVVNSANAVAVDS